MTKLLKNSTLDAIEAFERAPSVLKVTEAFRREVERHGYSVFLCSAPPLPGARNANPVLFEDWPAGWRQRYAERKYYLRDPMLFEMYASEEPYTWSDVLARREFSAPDRAIVSDATSFEMCEGFVVPIYGRGGQIHAVTMAGLKPRTDREARAELQLLSFYAQSRAKHLRDRMVYAPLVLREREREVLGWAAAGKSDWEIGQIIGVSESAVHKHIENVKRRLGVHTRVQAIVEAIRQNQLHL